MHTGLHTILSVDIIPVGANDKMRQQSSDLSGDLQQTRIIERQ